MKARIIFFCARFEHMPREIANTLLCRFATFPYVFCYKFALILYIQSFSSRHHLIFVVVNRELLTVFKKKVEECECDWPSVANGMVEWSLYNIRPWFLILAYHKILLPLLVLMVLRLKKFLSLNIWAHFSAKTWDCTQILTHFTRKSGHVFALFLTLNLLIPCRQKYFKFIQSLVFPTLLYNSEMWFSLCTEGERSMLLKPFECNVMQNF